MMYAKARPYLVITAAFLAITVPMVAIRPTLRLATVSLIYLMVVFFAALRLGRGPSLAAGLGSFLSLNYFFVAPHGTLRVDSTQDVISLLVFLVVGEITARLVSELREREAEARRRAWEAQALYTLTHDLGVPMDSKTILQRVTSRILDLAEARRCSIWLPDEAGRISIQATAPDGAAPPSQSDERDRAAAARVFETLQTVDSGRVLFLPLTAGDKIVGVLSIEPVTPGQPFGEARQRVLRSLAVQAGGAIERARLEREASEIEALRKTDELKSELLAAVSHDLRTPLASIRIAATALLQREVRSNEESRLEMLEMIDTEAARLSRLVKNLLDLSRIDAGVLTPEWGWWDLQEVVARAVDALHQRLRSHKVVTSLPSDLPLLRLDFTQIEDVLVNLLDNAVRHSGEGTTIHISAAQRGDEIVVQVENEGPSILRENAARIFDRFYRSESDRRGLGLGLAICKGLVEAHRGRIWVERPGEPGARFAFALPATAQRPSLPSEAAT